MIDGSYNSFVQQVGFCKLQSFDTISRSTSVAPPMFLDGRIKFGVGLSDVQFEGSTSSCGRCINITHIENFFQFDDELTSYNYSRPMTTPFTVFVMDQCMDPICTSKFLDFDIYTPDQPVAFGNPTSLEWEFIPCPVDNDTIELLFCLGPNSCNVYDSERRPIDVLLNDATKSGYWYCHVRNQRVPIINIDVSFGNSSKKTTLKDRNGWLWNDYDARNDLKEPWHLHLSSSEGLTKTITIDWSTMSDESTRLGYRGGILFQSNIQV